MNTVGLGLRPSLVVQLAAIAAGAAIATLAAIWLLDLAATRSEAQRLDRVRDEMADQLGEVLRQHHSALVDASALPAVVSDPGAALNALGARWGSDHLPAFDGPPRWEPTTPARTPAAGSTVFWVDDDRRLHLAERPPAEMGGDGWVVAPLALDALARSAAVDPTIAARLEVTAHSSEGDTTLIAGAAGPPVRMVSVAALPSPPAGTGADRTVELELALTAGHVPIAPLVPTRVVVWVGLVAALVMALVRVGRRTTAERLAHTTFALAAARTLAETDALTGLLNRQGLEQRVASLTDGAGATVFFVDLDNFKTVNDRMGHDTGDRILREVAFRLRHAVRTDDAIARLGGDEFVVLCPGLMGTDDADRLARRLLGVVREPPLVDDGDCRVGASIGYARRHPHDTTTIAGLLSLADGAMYEAKRRGGDQSCAAVA